MTPERWQQIDRLFHAALARTPEERAAFLTRACGADEELRREVLSLLAADVDAETALGHARTALPAEVAAEMFAEEQPLIASGQQLGPYRILSPLGTGGMGEVFLAQDARLGRKIALKLLPLHFTHDADRLRRFEQEAKAASALNHPNIITIYEISEAQTESGEVHFIATEFIDGQTLRQRLAQGKLELREALELAIQAGSALAAAHEAGIVHRDIKPENIMVRPDGLVKVLDFGLAKLTEAHAGELETPTEDKVKTEPGTVMGTLTYMSPEQARGLELDARTDIFSLGVVLIEMLTGRQPFAGATRADVIAAILEKEPPPLRESLPAAPAELQRIVSLALVKDRAARYQTASDFARDLKALKHELEFEAKLKDHRPRAKAFWSSKRLLVAGLAALVLFAVAIGAYLRFARKPDGNVMTKTNSLAAPSLNPRRSVAVLGFKNLSGRSEAAWLSTAFAEMLSTELAAGGKLRMIPGENVARMKLELALPDAESFAPSTLSRIRANLGSDVLILGSYSALGKAGGGQLRLDLKLQDATTGELIAAVAETGTEAKLFDLVWQAGMHLREKLSVAGLSEAEAGGLRASLPANQEAARLYVEGLQKIRQFEAVAARDLLEKAIAADPNYALAHSALAAAWIILGYDLKARAEAKRAFELSTNLSREERLMIEGRYREMMREWDKAVELARTLFNFFPDNLEHGVRLVVIQNNAGKSKDALATIETLRQFPAPARDDPRLDLFEAQAVTQLGNYKLAVAAATRAAEKAAAQGARIFVARALNLKAWALHNLGEEEQAIATANEAKQLFAAVGDQADMTESLNTIASVYLSRTNLAEAKQAYNEALSIRRQLGWQTGIALTLNNLAIVIKDEGKIAEANKLYQESLKIMREVGNRDGVGLALHNIAVNLRIEAKFSEAKQAFEEELAIGRETGNKFRTAGALLGLARIAFDQGQPAESRKSAEEALALCQQAGYKAFAGQLLSDLGSVLMAEGDLAGSRKRHEEALALRNSIGSKGMAFVTRLDLAALTIEEGRPAEAEAPAREVANYFLSEKLDEDAGFAYVVLARSLLAQGRTPEAQQASARALELVRKSEDRNTQLWFAINNARVLAAAGRHAEAAKTLAGLLPEAAKYAPVRLQFEARLALGEIEVKSDKAAAGRARLEALATEAKAKGFGLIARKAEAARG